MQHNDRLFGLLNGQPACDKLFAMGVHDVVLNE
jgi:hypothetical protein